MTTKNYINKQTTVIRKANNWTVTSGRYRAVVDGRQFETDNSGYLFYNPVGTNDWKDTGLVAHTKAEFIDHVHGLVCD